MSRNRALVAAVALGLALSACSSEEAAYEVLPPNAVVADHGSADLLQVWGRAWLEAPLEGSWFMNLGLCDGGLSTGEVYFAPTWPSENEWYATCTMRPGQVLFLVPAVALCVDAGGGVADPACLDQSWSLAASTVAVDGVAVEGLDQRVFDTAPFTVDLPGDNLFGVGAGSHQAIFRGQVILIEGLPAGAHQVVLSGDFGEGSGAGSLTITLSVAG